MALEPERLSRSEGTILLTRAPGYLLRVDAAELDSAQFERLVSEGRGLLSSDPPAASLGVFRGPGAMAGEGP